MGKRVFFVGQSLASTWDVDMWPDGYSFDQVVPMTAQPARSSEVNLIQQQQQIKLRNHIQQLMTSGWTNEGSFYFTGVNNQFAMGGSWLNIQGQTLNVANPDTVSTPVANNPTIPAQAFYETLPAPSNSARNDLVYLEMWIQEVAAVGSTDNTSPDTVDRNFYKLGGVQNGTFSNNIFWTAANTEPSRRLQIRWRLSVATGVSSTNLNGLFAQGGMGSQSSLPFSVLETIENSTVNVIWVAGSGDLSDAEALNCVDGFVYATPVALIARGANNSSIPLSAITDERVKARLQPGIQIDQTNIFPTLSNDSDLDHLMPSVYAQAGQPFGGFIPATGTTGNQQPATLDLVQNTFASRFTVNVANAGAEFVGLSTVSISRVSLFVGGPTPSSVIVQLYTDGGTAPSSLVGQAIIPSGWMTTTPREISVPLSAVLSVGSSYWIVARRTATSTLLAATTSAAGVWVYSSDGSTYASQTTGFGYGVYAGTEGAIVNSLTNTDDAYFFEYDSNQNMTRISEYFFPVTGTTRTYSRIVSYGYSGAITSIL